MKCMYRIHNVYAGDWNFVTEAQDRISLDKEPRFASAADPACAGGPPAAELAAAPDELDAPLGVLGTSTLRCAALPVPEGWRGWLRWAPRVTAALTRGFQVVCISGTKPFLWDGVIQPPTDEVLQPGSFL